jgi:hypothetical protein
MIIYSNNLKSAKHPPEELLINQNSNLRFLKNYTIKLSIMNNKKSIINYINNINERIYIITLSNMSNHALNVNIDLDYDMRSLCILHGV